MVAWENEIEGYTYYIKLEKKLSDNTVEAYLRDLRQMAAYMESEFSISDPEQVREQHVESFLAYLYDKGVEKTTQARVLSGIKSFFTFRPSSSTRPKSAVSCPMCCRSPRLTLCSTGSI